MGRLKSVTPEYIYTCSISKYKQLILSQETGEFTVQMKDVLQMHQNITTYKLLMEDNAGAVASLCSAYNKFLSHCNAVDFADVLHRVKTNFIVDMDAKDKFQTGQQFVVVGKPKTQLEVSDRDINFAALAEGLVATYSYTVVVLLLS